MKSRVIGRAGRQGQRRGQSGNDTLIARGEGAVDFLDGGGTDRARNDANDFAQFVEQLLA